MARQIQINISLEPVTQYDSETDTVLLYYKEFPEAFAEGKDVDEAENKLIPLLELMWQEKPKDLEKKLLENYISDQRHKLDLKFIFPRR